MKTQTNHSILLVSILLLFLNSCSTPSADEGAKDQYHIAFNYQNFPPSVNLSSMIQTFETIPLETSDECVVGRIVQIDRVGDLIFIRMYDDSRGIFVFNGQGKFLYQIGRYGRGPGEHTKLVSFSFNRDRTRIYLTAADQRKIIEYSLDGEWIKDIDIPHPISDLAFFSDSTYVSSNMEGYFVKLGNLISGVTVDTIKRYAGSFRYGGQIFYPSINHGVLFGTSFLDTLFYINEDEVIPRFIFDFRPNNVTKEDFKGGRLPFPFPPDLIWTDGAYFETEKWFYFYCSCERKSGEYKGKYGRSFFIYNKETKEVNHLATDDILFFGTYNFYNVTCTGEFAGYIDATYLLEKKEQILANEDFDYPEGLFKQLEAIHEEDNPILLFCRLK